MNCAQMKSITSSGGIYRLDCALKAIGCVLIYVMHLRKNTAFPHASARTKMRQKQETYTWKLIKKLPKEHTNKE